MAEQLTANDEIRDAVRERYAQAAESVGEDKSPAAARPMRREGPVAAGPMSRTPAKERLRL